MTTAAVLAFLSVVFSLIIMESLLSVDNALVLGAMASDLPKHQQRRALWYGLAGAYAFRGLALALATWLASNHYVMGIGALYLIYAMCKHLGREEQQHKRRIYPSFWGTVLAIEVADLIFAIDNVVAAVALSKDTWALVTGVAIGILSMRLLTGYALRLIEKAPILKKTAFLLLGVVGGFMLGELLLDLHLGETFKFGSIMATLGLSLLYAKLSILHSPFSPVFSLIQRGMGWIAWTIELPFMPVVLLARAIFPRKMPAEKPEDENETKDSGQPPKE